MPDHQFTRIHRDIRPTVGNNIIKLKAPPKTSLATAGNGVANEGEVILNRSDRNFYGHNGRRWLQLTGSSGTAYTSRTSSTAQTIDAGDNQNLPFELINSEKNITGTTVIAATTQTTFTVGIPGLYHISCSITVVLGDSIVSPPTNSFVELALFVNGVDSSKASTTIDGVTPGESHVLTIGAIIPLTTSDVVSINLESLFGETNYLGDPRSSFIMTYVDTT
uniref:Uncharacterized protein n=1 Tax=Marseillevirus LCMAC201 TaxID=2506605 RepID=A0A481YVZ7_9VIRU|nr:MAG: hypothetical protein LCMAC201_02780 [Marseillevirus LCMAC201]